MFKNDRQHDGHNDSAIEILTKKALNLVLKYTFVQKPESLNPNNWINCWFKKIISPQNIHEFIKRTLGELKEVYDFEDASARIELCLAWICESKTFQEFLEQEKLSRTCLKSRFSPSCHSADFFCRMTITREKSKMTKINFSYRF